MTRPRLAALSLALALLAVLAPSAAPAQPLATAAPSADAAPSASASGAPFPVFGAPPPPAPSQTAAPPTDSRPAHNPAIRERNAPRSRVGATMRGAVILVLLVFLAGYWIMKRVRRRF